MLRLSLAALACAVVLTGCGESLEGNPLFKEQQKTVARLDSETKSMGRQFEDVAITVSNLRQQVREMRNDPSFVPASNSSSGDIEATLRDLQARVASLEAQLGKSKSGANLASAPSSSPSSAPAKTASSSVAGSSDSSSSEARQTVRVSTRAADPPAEPAAVAVSLSRSEDREATIEVAAAVSKAPVAAPAAPRPAPRQEARASGSYYQVRDGDTPASVAREHGISVEKLSGANGIPAGRTWRLMPGQRIFVPKG